VAARRALLRAHREQVRKQLDTTIIYLDAIDAKIRLYENATESPDLPLSSPRQAAPAAAP
jgi:hypothetical protein